MNSDSPLPAKPTVTPILDRGSQPRQSALMDSGAALLLLALVALFFWRLWAPNPADRVTFPVGDFTEQYYPLRRFVAASLAEGHLPFWNPYIFGGQPGLADPQAAALYPPALLNAWLWGADFPLIALEAEAIAHLLLALWGAYFYIRRAIGLGLFPALTGAAIFGFGGYLTGFPLEQITILETSAWLPWLLLALHGAGEATRPLRKRVRWGVAAALLIALALLAGHPQSALYLFYIAGSYALFRLLLARRAGRDWWAALPLFLPFLLGPSLAAIQLLPTLHFIELSSRQQLNYQFVSGGLAWEELMTIFLPKVVGSTPLYTGVVTLLLLPLALLSPGQKAEKRFWGGAGLVSLLVAMGGNSFLFDLFYLGLPGLARVRSQERVLLLWGWSLALLAAWGVASLGQPESQRRLRRYVTWLAIFLPVLLLPLLVLWWLKALVIAQFSVNVEVLLAFFDRYSFFFLMFLLAWALLGLRARRAPLGHRAQAGFGLLLVALLLFDLFTVTRSPHIGGPPSEALPGRTEVVEALSTWQSEMPGRVAVVGQPVPRGNDGMRWGFPMLSGNEPLRLAGSEQFLQAAPAWRQIQLFAVRYVVAESDLAAADPAAFELLASAPPSSFLVRIRPPTPYGWLVGQTEQLPDRAAIYARMEQESFDPYQLALVELPLSLAGGSLPPELVVVERRAAGEAALRVTNPADGPVLLVVAEPAVRGWQATIDGRATDWVQANGLNLALPVPPGEHLVTLQYVQPGWQSGMLLSTASLIVSGTLLFWTLRKGRS